MFCCSLFLMDHLRCLVVVSRVSFTPTLGMSLDTPSYFAFCWGGHQKKTWRCFSTPKRNLHTKQCQNVISIQHKDIRLQLHIVFKKTLLSRNLCINFLGASKISIFAKGWRSSINLATGTSNQWGYSGDGASISPRRCFLPKPPGRPDSCLIWKGKEETSDKMPSKTIHKYVLYGRGNEIQ